MRRARTLLWLACGVLMTLTGSGPPPALARQDASPRIALGGPEVYKAGWNTRDLTVCDIDGDGLQDLVLINNERAKIDLFMQRDPDAKRDPAPPTSSRLWEPVLEDSRFLKESIVTGMIMYALAVGDLDGDGRLDLAYTGSPDALTVRYQSPAGDWDRRRSVDLAEPVEWSTSLEIKDINGDHKDDLVLLAESEIVILPQTAAGELGDPQRYRLAAEGCYGLQVADVNADKRPDLLYLLTDERAPLRYRLQQTPGRFGPEGALVIEPPQGMIQPIRWPGISDFCFATIQERTGLIEWTRLLSGRQARPEALALSPRIYYCGTQGRTSACYATGDFNGDGRLDLAVGDGRQAQVWLYLQSEGGGFDDPRSFPSLSDLRGMASADMNGDGRDDVLVVSPREKSLGWSEYVAPGRLEFPQALAIAGEPLAVAVGDVTGDGAADVIVARKNEDERQVMIMSRTGPTEAWREKILPLTGLRTNPMAVEIMDANQDGLSDIAVFAVQSPMRLLVQDAGGEFHEASLQSGYRDGLVDNLDPSATTLFDVDGDGYEELLVAGKGFARALRMNGEGALEVVDQFNARGGDIEISAAVGVDLDADGTAELLLKEKTGSDLQILRRDRLGVYRFEKSLPLGRIGLVEALVLDIDRDERPDVFFCGKDRFWWLPVGRTDLAAESLAIYESSLPDHVYYELAVGDIDGDGEDDLVTLDSTSSNILEILRRTGDQASGTWQSAFHFTVFEANPHYHGWQGSMTEPREMLVADVTGDGRADILLLAHDRILIYPNR
jgi:hypothetical protein